MIPESLVNEDDDWQEPVRRWLYPRLHPLLAQYGGYGIGTVGEDQYAVTLPAGEEMAEEVLSERGFTRNPIAAYKSHTDGRKSEGSWALTHTDDEYGLVEPGMQLHLTFFEAPNPKYVDVYAHYEDDWRHAPVDHLRGKNFSARAGRSKARKFFKSHTYLEWMVRQ